MRLKSMIDQNRENGGWAVFGTIIGMVTSKTPEGTFLLAMVTLACGVVLSYFLRLGLAWMTHKLGWDPPTWGKHKEDER